MAIATNQQITNYYDSYCDKEVIFSREILHTLRVAPREIYIKCGGNQWPCIINSTSLLAAKIILGKTGGAFTAITQKNAPQVSLRFCFFIDKGAETMSFFIAGKVTNTAQYTDSKDLAVVTLTYTQRPPDDFIVKIGTLIEANINFIKRREERIVMTSEARYRLGIEKEDTIIYVQNVPRKCILRDLSFSGAKVVLLGVPKFVSGKETVLRIVFDDPAETLDIRGSIVGADFAEGRQDVHVVQEEVGNGQPDQAQAHDHHAHDAASGERRLEGGTRVLRRCEGRTSVRVGRDVHPDVPGRGAAECTQHEGEGRPEPKHPPQQQGDDADEGRQPGVLLLEERHGPPVDDRRELDDTVVLDLSLTELLEHHPRIAACYDAKNKGNEHKNQPHSIKPPHNSR